MSECPFPEIPVGRKSALEPMRKWANSSQLTFVQWFFIIAAATSLTIIIFHILDPL